MRKQIILQEPSELFKGNFSFYLPEKLNLLLDTQGLQEHVHFINFHYFSSNLKVAKARTVKRPGVQMMEIRTFTLWGGYTVRFLGPRPVTSHQLVFKTWHFKICLIVVARNKA